MNEKPIQYFNQEYIDRCRGLSADEIVEYLNNFQSMVAQVPEKCQLISIKIEPSLLKAFKMKSKLTGIAYQTQIKKLMRDWLENK